MIENDKEMEVTLERIARCLCLPHHSLSSNAEDGGSVRQSNR